MWSSAPTVSFSAATLVVGSTTFTSLEGSCNGPTTFFADLAQLAADGGKLLIPSATCHRVMIWNPAPATSGDAAHIALGQAGFQDTASGNGAADLNLPGGVWTDGTRVVVADVGNHRVLIWTSFPTTNKQPADIVLGQPGFGTSGAPSPPTGATMRAPSSVHSDGVRLFVADSQNARVLVWRSFPTTSGQPADLAIGQPDLNSNGIGRGTSRLAFPTGITTTGDHLFVADSLHNRVLVFSPIPTSSGAAASFVLGQSNFETTSAGTTQETLRQPMGMAVGGDKLYVTDAGNHRVLRFALKL